jgi:hypothetical protein
VLVSASSAGLSDIDRPEEAKALLEPEGLTFDLAGRADPDRRRSPIAAA